jgi:D-cysteine desulfhydrase
VLPCLRLAVTPTPYQPAPRLAAALGLGRLLVKREDLSGPALGGNKIRSIELILAARTEGLLLDPSYTAKAMAGLAAFAPRGGSAAFLHSGGTPTLFAQAAAVLPG